MKPRLVALLPLLLASVGCTDDARPEARRPVTLTILDNLARDGKNSAKAEWILEYVIPEFEREMRDEGTPVEVELEESGIDDEDYRAGIRLQLEENDAPDILGFDQFWLAEFASAGLVRPLRDVVGPQVADWEGWNQIPAAIQSSMEFEGARYGIPLGTDGRVLFYNRRLFERAGLPGRWQPSSWMDVERAASTIDRRLLDVIPIQLNAGISMGEATTLQGFMPVLLGTGAELYDESGGAWLGDTPELRDALGLFHSLYSQGFADAELQQRPDGRDRSFSLFADGKIAILAESDYLWRSVINPGSDYFPMDNRDEVVGWTKFPAREPGEGIRGQDFVSASGGSATVLNPSTEHPDLAWELMTFMFSQDSLIDYLEREPRLSAREDVNRLVVDDDPLLSFVADEVLPLTWFRPGFPEYADISVAITEMVEAVASGERSIDAAAARYEEELIEIVGEENIRT